MKTRNQLSDQAFLTQFENCELTGSEFSHEAHLRLAWLHITLYGINDAIIQVTAQIKKFASFHGTPEIYNETLTIAALYVVHQRMLQSPSESFNSYIQAFPELQTDFKAIINQHYSFDVFQSIKAKHSYIAPDVIPFIFQ